MNQSVTQSHSNNFDFLRLLFATFVLITHSYALTGIPERDWLWKFSYGQTQFSRFGVVSFFAISGYLILKSLLRSQSLSNYYFKRIIRVFPALWALIGLTLITAYFISNKTLHDYLLDKTVHRYLLNLVLRIQYQIDGVFKQNPYSSTINGSLWTIPYEFFFYICITPLFFLRNKLNILRVCTIITFLILLFLSYTEHTHFLTYRLNLDSYQSISLGLFFSAGAILALFPSLIQTVQRRNILIVASGLALFASMIMGSFTQLQYFIVPLFVIALGTSKYRLLNWVRRYGDISYGIYVFGFPVQQLIWHFLQPSQPVMLLISVPITWALGFASWHFIESPALKLKLNLKKIPVRSNNSFASPIEKQNIPVVLNMIK